MKSTYSNTITKKETKDSFTLHSIIMKNEKNKIFQIMREQEFYKALMKKLRILCFIFPKDFSHEPLFPILV